VSPRAASSDFTRKSLLKIYFLRAIVDNKLPMVAFMAVMARERWTDERLDKAFGRIDADLHELRVEMRAGFEKIDHRFDLIEKRFEQVDKRFERVDQHLERVDKRLERFDEKFDAVDARFFALQQLMVKGMIALVTAILMLAAAVISAPLLS